MQENERFILPEDSAKVCLLEYHKRHSNKQDRGKPDLSVEEYEAALDRSIIGNMTACDSDAFLVRCMTAMSDALPCGDALATDFANITAALTHAIVRHGESSPAPGPLSTHQASEAAISAFSALPSTVRLPDAHDLMARLALLRALNRLILYALPYISMRPAQEGSAILGGTHGFGAGLDRVGRKAPRTGKDWSWAEIPSLAGLLR